MPLGDIARLPSRMIGERSTAFSASAQLLDPRYTSGPIARRCQNQNLHREAQLLIPLWLQASFQSRRSRPWRRRITFPNAPNPHGPGRGMDTQVVRPHQSRIRPARKTRLRASISPGTGWPFLREIHRSILPVQAYRATSSTRRWSSARRWGWRRPYLARKRSSSKICGERGGMWSPIQPQHGCS